MLTDIEKVNWLTHLPVTPGLVYAPLCNTQVGLRTSLQHPGWFTHLSATPGLVYAPPCNTQVVNLVFCSDPFAVYEKILDPVSPI